MRCIIAIGCLAFICAAVPAAAQTRSGDTPSTAAITKEGLPNLQNLDTRSINTALLPTDESGQPLAARVNGKPITVRRAAGAARRIVIQAKPNAPVPRATSAALIAPVIDDLVNNTLLEEYATSRSIHISGEEIDRTIEATNAKLPPGRKLQDDAMRRGITIEELRMEIRDQLMRDKLTEYERYRIPPPTPEQLAAFKRTPGVNVTSATVIRASHIALRSTPNDPPETRERARQRAEDILQSILEGLDFAEAARRYSQDAKTVDLAGDLGYFDETFMFPEFNNIVFKLNPGEISGVIQGPMALYIVKVTARETTNLQLIYRAATLKKRMIELVNELRGAAKIEKYL